MHRDEGGIERENVREVRERKGEEGKKRRRREREREREGGREREKEREREPCRRCC